MYKFSTFYLNLNYNTQIPYIHIQGQELSDEIGWNENGVSQA